MRVDKSNGAFPPNTGTPREMEDPAVPTQTPSEVLGLAPRKPSILPKWRPDPPDLQRATVAGWALGAGTAASKRWLASTPPASEAFVGIVAPAGWAAAAVYGGARLYHSVHKSAKRADQFHALESGPEGPAVATALERTLAKLPADRRPSVEARLSKEWDRLGAHFFDLFSDDPARAKRGAIALGSDAALTETLGLKKTSAEDAGAMGATAWHMIDMLSTSIGEAPGLMTTLNSQEAQRAGQWFGGRPPSLAEAFWLVQSRGTGSLPSGKWVEGPALLAALALQIAGVAPSKYSEALETAAALQGARGEQALESVDRLSPNAAKLAALALLSRGSFDWGRAYRALDDDRGHQYREELMGAGLADQHGLTPLGHHAVKAKVERPQIEALSRRYGSLHLG